MVIETEMVGDMVMEVKVKMLVEDGGGGTGEVKGEVRKWTR